MSPAHCVESLSFEVDFETPERAFEEQPRVMAFAQGRALQIIDEVFGLAAEPGLVWRLARLEVDLGSVQPAELEAQWEQRLRDRLWEALRDAPALPQASAEPGEGQRRSHVGAGVGVGHGIGIGIGIRIGEGDGVGEGVAAESLRHTRAAAQRETLLHYLRLGRLPWYAGEALADARTGPDGAPALDRLADEVLGQAGPELVEAWRLSPQRRAMVRRAVRQFAPAWLAELARAMAQAPGVPAAQGREARAWAQALSEIPAGAGRSGAAARERLWQALLTRLLSAAAAAGAEPPEHALAQPATPAADTETDAVAWGLLSLAWRDLVEARLARPLDAGFALEVAASLGAVAAAPDRDHEPAQLRTTGPARAAIAAADPRAAAAATPAPGSGPEAGGVAAFLHLLRQADGSAGWTAGTEDAASVPARQIAARLQRLPRQWLQQGPASALRAAWRVSPDAQALVRSAVERLPGSGLAELAQALGSASGTRGSAAVGLRADAWVDELAALAHAAGVEDANLHQRLWQGLLEVLLEGADAADPARLVLSVTRAVWPQPAQRALAPASPATAGHAAPGHEPRPARRPAAPRRPQPGPRSGLVPDPVDHAPAVASAAARLRAARAAREPPQGSAAARLADGRANSDAPALVRRLVRTLPRDELVAWARTLGPARQAAPPAGNPARVRHPVPSRRRARTLRNDDPAPWAAAPDDPPNIAHEPGGPPAAQPHAGGSSPTGPGQASLNERLWVAGDTALGLESPQHAPLQQRLWEGLLLALLAEGGEADPGRLLLSTVEATLAGIDGGMHATALGREPAPAQAGLERAEGARADDPATLTEDPPALTQDPAALTNYRAALADKDAALANDRAAVADDGAVFADPDSGASAPSAPGSHLAGLQARLLAWLQAEGAPAAPDPWPEFLRTDRAWARRTLLRLARTVRARRRLAADLPPVTLDALAALWLTAAEQALLQAALSWDPLWGPAGGAGRRAWRWQATLSHLLLQSEPDFDPGAYFDSVLWQRSECEEQPVGGLLQGVAASINRRAAGPAAPDGLEAELRAWVQTRLRAWDAVPAPGPGPAPATGAETADRAAVGRRRARLAPALARGVLAELEDDWRRAVGNDAAWLREILRRAGGSAEVRHRMAQTWSESALTDLAALWLPAPALAFLAAAVDSPALASFSAADRSGTGKPVRALWEATLGDLLQSAPDAGFDAWTLLQSLLRPAAERRGQDPASLAAAAVAALEASTEPGDRRLFGLLRSAADRAQPSWRAAQASTTLASPPQARHEPAAAGAPDAAWSPTSGGPTARLLARLDGAGAADADGRAGFQPELDRFLRDPPASERHAWTRALESAQAARRLAELATPAQLARLLTWLRPADAAAVERVLELMQATCRQIAAPPSADRLASLHWRFALRELFEEGRPFEAAGFARRLAQSLVGALRPPEPQRWLAELAASVEAVAPGVGMSPTSGGPTARLLARLDGAGAADADGRAGFQPELDRFLRDPPASERHAWTRALESAQAARRLAELATPAQLARLLTWLRPADAAAVERVLELMQTACRQTGAPASAPQLARLHWRFALRELFEEGRPFEAAGFARRLAQSLVGALRPPEPQRWLAELAASVGPPLPDPERSEDAAPAAAGESIYIANAGLVLAGPYLERLFAMLGLTAEQAFIDEAAAERAVHLLQYLVTGATATPEPLLVLNKILCGMPLEAPLAREVEISAAERAAIDGLLEAMIAHWKIIGQTSVAGLRESFLQREGRLSCDDEAWQLQVEPRAFDMLLDQLPWGYHLLKFPWMERRLHVDWR